MIRGLTRGHAVLYVTVGNVELGKAFRVYFSNSFQNHKAYPCTVVYGGVVVVPSSDDDFATDGAEGDPADVKIVDEHIVSFFPWGVVAVFHVNKEF